MSRANARPLSPHLSIWRWGPHMLVSILHRACGVVLATVGTGVFVWWLAALASGPESSAVFQHWVIQRNNDAIVPRIANGFFTVAAVGLTWAFFQHLANGVRHFVMDLGAGYELKANKTFAVATMVFAVVATVALWAYIWGIK